MRETSSILEGLSFLSVSEATQGIQVVSYTCKNLKYAEVVCNTREYNKLKKLPGYKELDYFLIPNGDNPKRFYAGIQSSIDRYKLDNFNPDSEGGILGKYGEVGFGFYVNKDSKLKLIEFGAKKLSESRETGVKSIATEDTRKVIESCDVSEAVSEFAKFDKLLKPYGYKVHHKEENFNSFGDCLILVKTKVDNFKPELVYRMKTKQFLATFDSYMDASSTLKALDSIKGMFSEVRGTTVIESASLCEAAKVKKTADSPRDEFSLHKKSEDKWTDTDTQKFEDYASKQKADSYSVHGKVGDVDGEMFIGKNRYSIRKLSNSAYIVSTFGTSFSTDNSKAKKREIWQF